MKLALKVVASIVLLGLAIAQEPPAKSPKNGNLVRGKYLVEEVATCGDCHSPRNEKGQFDRARWLGGSPLPFKPTMPMIWADTAPPVAGLPGWTRKDAIRFFTTGVDPNGLPARPPMPKYRLTTSDAAAISAYLESLKPTLPSRRGVPP